MFLSESEADRIDARIAHIEARVGVQIVTAIIEKADAYVEIPWKAFALGTTVAAFIVVLGDWLRPDWPAAHASLWHALASLGVGAACALVTVFAPPVARLFLRETRRDVEVRHYAESLFLRRELFRTRGRNGVLILVSRFERKVEILPDVGLHDRVSEADWGEVMARMARRLAEARFFDALEDGLGRTEELLAGKGFRAAPGSEDELPDRPIEEASSS